MLAQATTLIPYPSSAVAAHLLESRDGWSVALDGRGDELLGRVGVAIGKLPLYKQVRLVVGTSRAAAGRDTVMLPVSWTAVGGPPLFPSMEGTLHVEPDGLGSARLTLNARYDPPMGALGALIDRALLYRLAQATMDDFVGRLAASLTTTLREAPEATSSGS